VAPPSPTRPRTIARPTFVGLAIQLRTAFGGAARPTFVGLAIQLRTAFGGAARPTFVGLAIQRASALAHFVHTVER
jgi:hypothetical protein